jgi:hypothetical protein
MNQASLPLAKQTTETLASDVRLDSQPNLLFSSFIGFLGRKLHQRRRAFGESKSHIVI